MNDSRKICFFTLALLISLAVYYQFFHSSAEGNDIEKPIETATTIEATDDDDDLLDQVALKRHKAWRSTFLEHASICYPIHALLYKQDSRQRIRMAKEVFVEHFKQTPSITSYFFVLVLVVLLVVAAVDVSKNYKDANTDSRRFSLADYASNKRKLSKMTTIARHKSCSSASAQSSFDTIPFERPPLRKQSSAFHASLRDMASVNRRSSVAVIAAVQIMKNQQLRSSLRRQSTESHSGDDNDSPERRRVRMIHRH